MSPLAGFTGSLLALLGIGVDAIVFLRAAFLVRVLNDARTPTDMSREQGIQKALLWRATRPVSLHTVSKSFTPQAPASAALRCPQLPSTASQLPIVACLASCPAPPPCRTPHQRRCRASCSLAKLCAMSLEPGLKRGELTAAL